MFDNHTQYHPFLNSIGDMLYFIIYARLFGNLNWICNLIVDSCVFGYSFSNCFLETMFIKYLTHSPSAKNMNKSNVSICDVFSHRRNCSKYVMMSAIEICGRFLSKTGLPSIKSISVTSGVFVITNTSVFMDYITQSVMAFGQWPWPL